MKKFLTRKVGGFMVTMELILTIVAWSYFMSGAVYIINAQLEQKYMYNAFITSAMLTSKWGGTYSNLYMVNGKTSDLAQNMQRQVSEVTGQPVTITCSPTKVTVGDDNIHVHIQWYDPVWAYVPATMTHRPHTMDINFKSVVKGGRLL